MWVEPVEDRVNDGVSSVIVGGNDWAGAWAIDGQGRPAFACVPGGEPQREMAMRFGVNLVMYVLTGNYKIGPGPRPGDPGAPRPMTAASDAVVQRLAAAPLLPWSAIAALGAAAALLVLGVRGCAPARGPGVARDRRRDPARRSSSIRR